MLLWCHNHTAIYDAACHANGKMRRRFAFERIVVRNSLATVTMLSDDNHVPLHNWLGWGWVIGWGMNMKRIALLYADTGGGHRSAAEAVARGIEMLYGTQYDVVLLNAISHLSFPFNQMERSYPAVVNGPRVLHKMTFYATNSRRRSWIMRKMLQMSGSRMAFVVLQDNPADVYVSCSPVYSQVLPHYMRQFHCKARLVVVATDMVSGHSTNYAPEADFSCVPTEHTRFEAIQNGVSPERICVTGQPVWPDLRQRMAAPEITRAELGFNGTAPVVLLIGGGDGMGQLGPTGRAIALSGLPVQLVIVCGRNQAVKQELDQLQSSVPLKTLGFVNNVPELMGAADILITKAGAATVGEAFIARLPILLYDAVPGQEEGNVTYVVRQGAGAWCPTSQTIVKQLRELLAHPDIAWRMRQASARLARPDSALDIARVVTRLCN
jgi:1,2-diacylglycerol 3-beta-galactosyltransferase